MLSAKNLDGNRRGMLAKVHIAKKELGLSDEIYRDLLSTKFGVSSSASLSLAQLNDLCNHFKAKGFKAKSSPPKRAGGRKQADGPEHRKIRALWLSLYHLGVVSDPAESALVKFTKRLSGGQMKGIDALQWLNGDQRYKVIEALKTWATRDGGVQWVAYKDAMGRVLGHNDRGRVIEAQWRILKSHKKTFTPVDVHEISDVVADELIERQGAEIRRAKAVPQ